MLQTDGAYNQQRVTIAEMRRIPRPAFKLESLSEDTQMTAKGQAAVLDLGARRDLSKRAVLKVTVVTKTGHEPKATKRADDVGNSRDSPGPTYNSI